MLDTDPLSALEVQVDANSVIAICRLLLRESERLIGTEVTTGADADLGHLLLG